MIDLLRIENYGFPLAKDTAQYRQDFLYWHMRLEAMTMPIVPAPFDQGAAEEILSVCMAIRKAMQDRKISRSPGGA